MTSRYIDELSLRIPVIACNGGLISGTDLKTVIWMNPIRRDLLKPVLAYLTASHADIVVYTPDKVYYSANSVRLEAFQQYNSAVRDDLRAPIFPITTEGLLGDSEKFIKILLFSPTPEQETYLRSIKEFEVVSSGENSLDIMQKGSTKGNAVIALAKHLDVSIKNVAVFGDNENDISMFHCGALSVAMGNSLEFVKAEAQYVTATNAESGVAQAIEKYVLPRFGYTK